MIDGGSSGGQPSPDSLLATVAAATAAPAGPPLSSLSRRMLTRAGRSTRLRLSRPTDVPDGHSRSRSRSRSGSPPSSTACRSGGGGCSGGGGIGGGAGAPQGLERRLSFSAGRSLSRLWSKTDVSGRRARSRLVPAPAATADGGLESEALASSLSGSTAAAASGGEGGEAAAASSLSPSPLPLVPVMTSSRGLYGRGGSSGGGGGGGGDSFIEVATPVSPAVPVSLSGDYGLSWPVPTGSADCDAAAERGAWGGAGDGGSDCVIDESPASPPSPLPASSLPGVAASAGGAPASVSTPPRMWLGKNATISRKKSHIAPPSITAAAAVDEFGGKEESSLSAAAAATLRSGGRPLSISRRHWRAATLHRTQSSTAGSQEAEVAAVSAPSAGRSPPVRSGGYGSGGALSRGNTSIGGSKTFRPWSSVSRALGKPASLGTVVSPATNDGEALLLPSRMSLSESEGEGMECSESGEGHASSGAPVGRLSLPGNLRLMANGHGREVVPGSICGSSAGGGGGGGDATVSTVAVVEDDAWNGRGWAGNLSAPPPRGGAGSAVAAVDAPPAPLPSTGAPASGPPSPSLAVVALGPLADPGGSGSQRSGSQRSGSGCEGHNVGVPSDGIRVGATNAGDSGEAAAAAASSDAAPSSRTGGRRPFLGSPGGGGVASLARALLTVRHRLQLRHR